MTQPKIEGVGHGVPRMLYASDGSNWYAVLVDSDGHVKVDVVASALPTDAATATNQSTMITTLQSIEDLMSANPKALDVVTTDIEVVNTTAETTIYTQTIPGGTLAANNLLRLEIVFSYLNNYAAAQTYNVKVKYGATTLVTLASAAHTQSATRWVGTERIFLKGDGATNAQRAMCWEYKVRVNTAQHIADEGTSAIDSTIDKDLVVTVTHLSADAAVSYIRRAATLELMEAL